VVHYGPASAPGPDNVLSAVWEHEPGSVVRYWALHSQDCEPEALEPVADALHINMSALRNPLFGGSSGDIKVPPLPHAVLGQCTVGATCRQLLGRR
jgi:hypothetical protein